MSVVLVTGGTGEVARGVLPFLPLSGEQPGSRAPAPAPASPPSTPSSAPLASAEAAQGQPGTTP